jgi:hypothetical protein
MMKPNPASRLTVLQVISSPHSGSTILGVILGSSSELFYGGEMDQLPDPIWRSGFVCSCGAPTADCPFWGSVRTAFESTHDWHRLEQTQRKYETWISLPRTMAAALLHQSRLHEHARETVALLRAVAEKAGKPIIVDTSKFAGRALVYSVARTEGLDVRYLHLVRDGRAVIGSRKARWSARGVDTESVQFATWSARRWLLANLAFSVLFAWRRGRYLRLRQEDFVQDPEGTLMRIERFLGISLEGPLQKLREGSAFPVVHVPSGNRLRLAGEVRFRKGPSSPSSTIPSIQQRAFWRVAGSLARLYGYEKDPPAADRGTTAVPPTG